MDSLSQNIELLSLYIFKYLFFFFNHIHILKVQVPSETFNGVLVISAYRVLTRIVVPKKMCNDFEVNLNLEWLIDGLFDFVVDNLSLEEGGGVPFPECNVLIY